MCGSMILAGAFSALAGCAGVLIGVLLLGLADRHQARAEERREMEE